VIYITPDLQKALKQIFRNIVMLLIVTSN
jgi:hypothetical protein